MIKKPFWFCIILLVLLLAGCANSTQDTPQDAPSSQPNIRAAFKPSSPNTIKVTVFVEGPDGNALSGAVVIIKDSRNSLLPLMYESSTCSYTGLLEEYSGETEYTVEVASILSNSIISLTVPYTKLESTPNVTVFQDADGNSVLSGQTLSTSQPIQIGWSDCGKDVVYQITIKTMLTVVYAISTNASTITIPANAIPAGNYVLEITAQKIHGDMYYRTSPYYSVSVITAPLINCHVN